MLLNELDRNVAVGFDIHLGKIVLISKLAVGAILRIDRHGQRSYAKFTMVDSWSAWMLPAWEPARAFGRRWPVSQLSVFRVQFFAH